MALFGARPEWFGPLYALSYLVSFLVAAWVGYRKGWPPAAWLLVLVAAGIGGVVGTRFLPLGLEGLRTLLETGALPETPTKRVPGAVAGALLLAVGARWALGLRRSVLDPLAYAGLAALVVARIGCLVAGCCFGTPTDLPWGVTYASGSFAHGFHLAHGIVEAGATAPHPVHPIPLYDIAFALIGLALLPRLSRILKAPGSLCWATVGGYAAYRFVQDFVRANEVVAFGGLTAIQLVCAGAVLAALAYVVVRERRARRQSGEAEAVGEPALARLAMVFAGLIAMRVGLEGWLTSPEEAVLFVRFLPAGAALAVVAWQRGAVSQVRWAATLAAAGLPVVLGFQLVPTDSTQGRFSYWAVEAHAAQGTYVEFDICSSELLEYQSGGVGVAHVAVDPNRSLTQEVGVRVYGGPQETAENVIRYGPDGMPTAPTPAPRESAFVVAPYLQVEGKYLGGHFGGQFGQLPILGGDESDVIPAYISAGARIGPRASHVHIGMLDGAQFGVPAQPFRIGAGTGWLSEGGQEGRIQGGLSIAGGLYGLATIPVDPILLEVLVSSDLEEAFSVGGRARVTLGHTVSSARIPLLDETPLDTLAELAVPPASPADGWVPSP